MLSSLNDLTKDMPPRPPQKSGRDTSTPGSSQQQTSQAGGQSRGASTLMDHLAFINSKGYELLPEDDRRPWPRGLAKATGNGRVVALKLLDGATHEQGILQYLQSLKDNRKHVVKLIETMRPQSGVKIIAMPWESQLDVFLGGWPTAVESLGTQFLEGVYFLHEHHIAHLDLKPGNVLVGCADTSLVPRLSIIDFGVSIRVESEETMVEGYRGTPSWTAPEVGTEFGPIMTYSAILADRWSCGQTLQYISQFDPTGRATFEHTYSRLLVQDPSMRSPLGELLDILQAKSSWTRGTTKRGADTNKILKSPKRLRSTLYVPLFLCHVPTSDITQK